MVPFQPGYSMVRWPALVWQRALAEKVPKERQVNVVPLGKAAKDRSPAWGKVRRHLQEGADIQRFGRLTLGCSYPSCSSRAGKLTELNQVLGLQEVEKALRLLRLRAC